jgi:hypothetical protein
VGDVVFVVNEPEMLRLTKTWQGSPGLHFARQLRTLETRARLSAGVDTGALRGRMETRRTIYPEGLQAHVGTPVPYGKYHHEGTRPHIIRPRKGKYLKFTVAGRVVFARSVRHPGTRPNPFLTRWLREVVG